MSNNNLTLVIKNGSQKEYSFDDILDGFSQTKYISEFWRSHTGRYGLHDYINAEDGLNATISDDDFFKIERYRRREEEKKVWGFLSCIKCGYEWAFEKTIYVEKEENQKNNQYICDSCRGEDVTEDGLVNVSDDVRAYPYAFIENNSMHEALNRENENF